MDRRGKKLVSQTSIGSEEEVKREEERNRERERKNEYGKRQLKLEAV